MASSSVTATTEEKKIHVLVCGGGGFIGSHLAKRMRDSGKYWVRVADLHSSEFFHRVLEYCDEFLECDLRLPEDCQRAMAGGVEWVFQLAADMGGMGFIHANHADILYNSTMISLNTLEAARNAGTIKKFFYSSSACVYPDQKQLAVDVPALKESDAWQGRPQDAYGLEKLFSETAATYYGVQHGGEMEVRIGRFHNIYGPYGTWCGGREKAPAAFLRKAICSTVDMEVWGDGEQTRSFCYIDDCVEGILRLMRSDCREPLNIGSSHLVSMNDMARLALELAGKPEMPLRHVPTGPQGVRGRNSDNTRIKEVLDGWEPQISLCDGMQRTYEWIRAQVDDEKARGFDVSVYAKSKLIG